MKALKEYLKLQEEIYEYFGYTQHWEVIPLEDSTDCYWELSKYDVVFSETLENFTLDRYYRDALYTSTSTHNSVFRGKDYTLIVVNTHTDDNKFLRVFDNGKELKNMP